MIRTALAFLALTGVPSGLAAQGVKERGAQRPGDAAMTCEQLRSEAEALDGQMASLSAETQKMVLAQQAGRTAEQQVGSMAARALSGVASVLLPGVGGMLASGVGAISSGAGKLQDPTADIMKTLQPTMERQTAIAERIEHVSLLYMDRCS